MKTPVLALALALALAGCSAVPPIDTSSVEARQASIGTILPLLSPEKAEALKVAVAKLDAGIPIGEGKPPLTWAQFDHPTVSDLLAVTHAAEAAGRQRVVAPDWPNPANAANLLRTYRIEAQLLDARREASLLAGQQLVDQFPLTDFQFQPPRRDGGLAGSEAVFRFEVANNTRFDTYRPALRVSITVPDDPIPVFDRTFEAPANPVPIGPGDATTLEHRCCGALADPYHHEMLSTLPLGAKISAELYDILDHSGKSMIDKQAYSVLDESRRLFLGHCIAYLGETLATWVPPKDRSECLPADELERRREIAAQSELGEAVRRRLATGPDRASTPGP